MPITITKSEIIGPTPGIGGTITFTHMFSDGTVYGPVVERRPVGEDATAWLQSSANLLLSVLAAAELSSIGEGE